jgi:hypothetical protein
MPQRSDVRHVFARVRVVVAAAAWGTNDCPYAVSSVS